MHDRQAPPGVVQAAGAAHQPWTPAPERATRFRRTLDAWRGMWRTFRRGASDDRGRRICLRWTETSPGRADPEAVAAMLGVLHQERGAGLNVQVSSTHLVLGVFAFIAMALTALLSAAGSASWAAWIPALCTIAALLATFRLKVRLRWPRLCATALGHGRCPACLYNLNSLQAEGDGCVVCPECSAAWRASRLGGLVLPQPPAKLADDGATPSAGGWRERFSRPRAGRLGVLDAQDRLVWVIDRRLNGLDEPRRAAIDPPTLALIERRLNQLGRANRILWCMMLLGLGLGLAGWLVLAPAPFWLAMPLTIRQVLAAVVLAAAGWMAWGALRSNDGVDGDAAAALWLRQRLCPRCGRHLSKGAESEERRTQVTCACGAEWNVVV